MQAKPLLSSPMPSEERRAATVETVIELAAERNPNDITTAAIATHMGVTQGALFRHFASKDAILQAVMAWVSERLLARVDHAARSAPRAEQALEAVFMAHIGFVCEHPGVPRLMFGELQRADDTLPKRMARTLMQGYRKRLEALLQSGKDQGAFDADLDVGAAATLLIGMVQGLVVQALFSGNIKGMQTEAKGAFTLYRRSIAVQTQQTAPSTGAQS